jgi:AraC-like DNA-binding protein
MAPARPTNLASLTRGILEWAERQGVERAGLLRSVDLDAHALDDADARVPREAHVSLWRETERELGAPEFGLRSVGGILSASTMGVVGLLAMTSANVEESVARAVTHFGLLMEDVAARSYATGELFVIELTPRTVQPRALADASLASFLHFMRAWTGEDVRAREVFVQHAQPADLSDYERIFGCRVRFGQPTNAIVLDREVMALPLRTAQPDVSGYLARQARAKQDELARREGNGNMPSSLAAAVRDAVEAGDARIGTVARHLGVGARTLQRTLAARGLAYRQLVDDARWALAGPLVAATELPFEEIAERLGYGDAKAFRRAFRRWSGLSPSEARKKSS